MQPPPEKFLAFKHAAVLTGFDIDSANSSMGDYSFASDAEEDASLEKLDLIYTVLNLMGYEYEGI